MGSPGHSGHIPQPQHARGAYVTHPSHTHVFLQVRKDKVGTELITELQKAIRELIQDFMEANRGMKPERILFYRDGVSEGPFSQCLDQELPLLHVPLPRKGVAIV